MKTRPVGLNRTTTATVLGPNTSVPETWKRHYDRLLELRARVKQDADELAKDSGQAAPRFSMHPADAATDSFDRDLAFSLLAMEDNASSEIDAALDRIRKGSYGLCELSGKLIPRRRLEAIPWARYTVEAQAEMESNGNASRAHLNKLESIQPQRSET